MKIQRYRTVVYWKTGKPEVLLYANKAMALRMARALADQVERAKVYDDGPNGRGDQVIIYDSKP